MELAGKNIGIMGLGNIGMKVATIARDFGMDVYALTSKNASDLPDWITKVNKDGLLAVSDILSLHSPLSDDTYHFINAEAIEKMKDTAILQGEECVLYSTYCLGNFGGSHTSQSSGCR